MLITEELTGTLAGLRRLLDKAEETLKTFTATEMAKTDEIKREREELTKKAEAATSKAQQASLQAAAAREHLLNEEARIEKLMERLTDKCEEVQRLDQQLIRYQSKLEDKRWEAKQMEAYVDKLEAKLLRQRPGKKLYTVPPPKVDDRRQLAQMDDGAHGFSADENEAAQFEARAIAAAVAAKDQSPSIQVAEEPANSTTDTEEAPADWEESLQSAQPQPVRLEQNRVVAKQRSRSPLKRLRVKASSRSRSRSISQAKPEDRDGREQAQPFCFLHIVNRCRKGDACSDRHLSSSEVTELKSRAEKTHCRYGVECTQRDCIFKHAEGRQMNREKSGESSLVREPGT